MNTQTPGPDLLQVQTRTNKWKRLLLLVILAYEAAGCLSGGVMLVYAPDGSLMDMPVSLMHGYFENFLLPGIILFILGILNAMAFTALLRSTSNAKLRVLVAMGGLMIWFTVEIAILREVHWLHAMWGLPVVAGVITAIALYLPRVSLLRK